MREIKANRRGETRWPIEHAITIYGLAVWWRATLAPGIVLSTAPDAPMTHWEQLYFPLLEPLAVAPGETLVASLRSTSSPAEGTNLAWTVSALDKAGKSRRRLAMDLEKGYLP
jgi:protein arginine N-methyltransferase 1